MASSNGSANGGLLVAVQLTRTLVPNGADPTITLPSPYGAGLAAHRLTVTAQDPDDPTCDIGIFVFQREVVLPDAAPSETEAAFFTNVASANDMEELPMGVPDDDAQTLFRYHTIDVITRSLQEAEFVWDEIQKDVRGLITHNKTLQDPPGNVTQTDTVTID